MDNNLENLRKNYIRIYTPKSLEKNGWNSLRVKIAEEEIKNRKFSPYFILGRGLAITSLIVFFLTLGTFGAAQASKPGDTLFPVKLLSEDIITKATGNYDLKVQRRAEELIEISKRSPERLEEATRQYQQTLSETQKVVEETGQTEQFKKTLDSQQEKFNQLISKNPSMKKKLQEVMNKTEQVRKDVKGAKIENKPSATPQRTEQPDIRRIELNPSE